MSTPNCTSPQPLPLPLPVTISLFSKSMSLFLLYKFLCIFFFNTTYKQYHMMSLSDFTKYDSLWAHPCCFSGLYSFNRVCVCVQSYLTLCSSMDCSPPGSSVHGILRARILEWVAISYSRDLPVPGIDPTSLGSPAPASGFFTTVPPGKPPPAKAKLVLTLRIYKPVCCIN